MRHARFICFKLYTWEDIAGTSLLIDTTCGVRRPAPGGSSVIGATQR